MKRKEPDEVFKKHLKYQVFLRNVEGGGRVAVFMEAEARGVSDMIYNYTADAEKKKVLLYEISSPGVANRYWMNRAELGNMGYVGMIEGYGAKEYFLNGGNLKEYIRDYGEFAPQPGILKKLFRFIFK